MNKKIFILIILASVFLSCSDSEKSDFIGVTIYRTDDEFANSLKNNIVKFISGKARYVINDSENVQRIQNEQIDDFISKGVKVLVINLVDPQAAENIINKAKENDIPLILFNKSPYSFDIMNTYNKVWYVGTISEEAAYWQGKIISESWQANPSWDKNGDGKIQCVILKGEPGHIEAEIRTENLILFLNQNGIETEILDSKTGMWNMDKAKAITDSWMSDYNNEDDSDTKIEYIFSNNDAMTLGALKSIQEFGYNIGNPDKYIPIVGIDGSQSVISEIKKGSIVGTVLNDAEEQAEAVSDLAVNLFKGVENPILGTSWKLDDTKSIKINYRPITMDNIDE